MLWRMLCLRSTEISRLLSCRKQSWVCIHVAKSGMGPHGGAGDSGMAMVTHLGFMY